MYKNKICSGHRGYDKLIRDYSQKIGKEKKSLEDNINTDLTEI
jgi:hypothetical protein